MEQKLLSPKSDLIFKKIFGDTKNTDILVGFLQTVLDLPDSDYKQIEIADPHLQPDMPDDKLGILDIKVYTSSGNIVDVEIQLLDMPEMRERIVFYTAKMVTEQIKKGEAYDTIKRAISIVITDFVLIRENQSYHNCYRLCDMQTGSEFTNVLEVNVLELPKLPEQQDNSELWEWLQFLNSESEEELTMLARKNKEINKAVGILRELSADEKTRRVVELEEKARRDERARLNGAKTEGLEEGIEIGRAEGREEGRVAEKMLIAKNLIKNGMSTDTIVEVTGLSAEEIEKLR